VIPAVLPSCSRLDTFSVWSQNALLGEIMSDLRLRDELLAAIEKRVDQNNFTTWFKPINHVHQDGTVLHIGVPNRVFGDWLLENYTSILIDTAKETGLDVVSFECDVVDKAPTGEASAPAAVAAAAAGAGVPYGSAGRAESPDESQEKASNTPTNIPLNQLNQRYTFETFVVGSCNQFAHAASVAVADSLSRAYNPLYIYGGVGLGKTHLMCAIGHRVKRQNKSLKLSYISAETFMNDLINAIRFERTGAFRDLYRSIDVLLIDDIQFIAGKEATQEEFFHTFNALYDGEKQIVISSDCPPREIPTLEERLHSRFEWGLIADIQPPDLETKVAILRRKAEAERIDLPDSVALFIASKIKSNIRELEGSLVRLTALSSLRGEPISIGLAQEAIKKIVDEEERSITIELIQKVVADSYSLRVADLKSKSNARSIAVPRQIAMYLCKKLTKASLPEIGREFGGKHHTTVLHSINKIAGIYEQEGTMHRHSNSLIDNCR
jgi:chromosomal replication initiator protein